MASLFFYLRRGGLPFLFRATKKESAGIRPYLKLITSSALTERDGQLYVFPNDVGAKSTSFVQRLGDYWLLVEGRGGIGRVCNQDGIHLTTFNFGDAIQDVQTTAYGRIWVSYFDEGIFGNGIGANGLVCFDAQGNDIYRFAEFAETVKLPHIDDCYALNVSESETWLSYYSDFPLVCLSNFKLQSLREGLGSFSAFAIAATSSWYSPHISQNR